jgi:hypothetical protein
VSAYQEPSGSWTHVHVPAGTVMSATYVPIRLPDTPRDNALGQAGIALSIGLDYGLTLRLYDAATARALADLLTRAAGLLDAGAPVRETLTPAAVA